MLGVDVFLLRTPFEDFFVRVQPASTSLTPKERDLARRALFDLRVALEAREPETFELAQRLINAVDSGGQLVRRLLEPAAGNAGLAAALFERLEQEFSRGRLVVEREAIQQLTDQREVFFPELPPLPKAAPVAGGSSFELRLVDEIGQAINGVDAEFLADGPATVPTNAAGVALLDGVQASSASVSFADPTALEKVLDPRWQKVRPGKPPKEANLQEVVFRGGELGPFGLKAEVPNTVVVKPPLGRLFVELFDKTGRVRHANCTFEITGPQTFEGTTDEQGRLQREGVFPGDYQLSLALSFFEENDPDRQIDIVDSPLVVLQPETADPLVRMIGAVPRSILARLHMFFNTNKAFLLPTALPSVLKLRKLYAENTPGELLVVGHADTRGGTAYNDKLSLERAEAIIAYLKDDHDAWLKFYGANVEQRKRWGKVEDHLMIIAMPDFVTKPKGEDEIRFFQRTRKLEVDGVAGTETRTALIKEYMSLDGAKLTELGIDIEATAHGCGENFPLDDTGEQLDTAPEDEKRDRLDRRVELYFFDPEFGITPKPPGQNSKPGSVEYPKWRERVAEVIDLREGDTDLPTISSVVLSDAHFRTDSAVVLPEGEAPDSSEHASLTSVGVFATTLVFAERNSDKKLVVAGHTDTEGKDEQNQPLSEERAECALACLLGTRQRFTDICDERHQVADYKQILSWAAKRFGFDCNPGKIDNVASTAVEPLRRFQGNYNANRSVLGVPNATALKVDGKIGPETWGAIFDCYEAALAAELSDEGTSEERLVELAELRKNVVFVNPDKKSVGFGETHPVDELGEDEFESQANRRVELMFFENGIEPDLDAPPESSEIFLPGNFNHVQLPALSEGEAQTRGDKLQVVCLDELNAPIVGAPFLLALPNGRVVEGTLDASGSARALAVPPGVSSFVCQVDESQLPAPVDGAQEAIIGDELAAGVQVPLGVTTLRVGLAELLVATDLDAADEEDLVLTLAADDGSFTKTLRSKQDGTSANGGIDVRFSGLPTIAKTYTLRAGPASEEPDIVFQGSAFRRLEALADALSVDQIEPGLGQADGRISELDTGQGDGSAGQDDDVAVA